MQTLFNILTSDNNVIMQYEIAIMLCAFFVSAALLKDRKKTSAAWMLVCLLFIYIHRVLLPFIVSGLYLLLISGIICAAVKLDPRAFFLPVRKLKEKAEIYTEPEVQPYTAVILTVLLIQLCRINICIDYDSIRYGLRSDVLLTDGMGIAGFFTNTGLVNSVYNYPKGFEVLTRPLYFGNTYSYVLCVNVWMLIVLLMLAGEITHAAVRSRGAEVLAAMLAALMPGITNMSVTAKSDIITAVCQLVFVLCVMLYVSNYNKNSETAENAGNGNDGTSGSSISALPGIGAGALILSLSFKPTAFVFSSFAGIAAVIYFSVKKIKLGSDRTGTLAFILQCAFTAVITARTFIITGHPVSGVFTALFESLGMKLKYPFRSQSFLYKSDAAGAAERIGNYISRVLHFLFCPVGEDMSHVFMAWGGIAFLILLIVIIIFAGRTSEKMGEMDRLTQVESKGYRYSVSAYSFLGYIFIIVGITSLISLYLLFQVDGNYFMLLYALTAALGTAVIFTGAQYELSPFGKKSGRFFAGGNSLALILLSAVMIWFTAFTGWCGAPGFTKADFVNKGYYDHDSEYRYDFKIWDKYTRVLALAYEPDCYRIKGRVESWVDIDGSGGNVYLTDTKFNIFKDYLEFAGIEYIYADLNFISDRQNPRHERADTLFNYLLEDGCFEEVYLLPGSSDRIVAKLDRERVAVDWETPVSRELEDRIILQKNWENEIR